MGSIREKCQINSSLESGSGGDEGNPLDFVIIKLLKKGLLSVDDGIWLYRGKWTKGVRTS